MKTVKTAFSVLREISTGEFSLTELANRMGMDKASMHRYLRTLTAEGFVEQNPDTRIYKLGLAVIELSGLRLAQMDVVSIASPHLKQLGQATQETVQLSILNDQHLLFLHIIESTHSLRFSNRLGDRMPPYYSAAGKLLLAYEPESELMDYFSSKIEPLTAKTIVEPEKIRKQLATIRKKGLSYDDENWIKGLRAVAAPIRNIEGQVIAAVAVGGPTGRVSKDRLTEFGKLLRATAQRISHDLGWPGEN